MNTAFLVLCLALAVRASTTDFMLTMRDGVRLDTTVDTPLWVNKAVDVVLDRSPYCIFCLDIVSDLYMLLENYVAVRQSNRGCQKSEGTYDLWASSGNDSYDTSAWIHSQNFSNGNLLSVGASADGITELFDLRAVDLAGVPHPPVDLKSMFIIFSTGDARGLIYPGGAFQKALVETWLTSSIPNAAVAVIKELKAHENPDVPYWSLITAAGHFDRVTWPAVFWGGWYDIFITGLLWTFDGFQTQSQTAGQHRLVIDPLGHCQKASSFFPTNLIAGRVLLPIFLSIDMFRNTSVVPENVKKITFYVMAPNELFARGNHWTTMDAFPTFVPVSYYMYNDRTLVASQPPPANGASETYKYDPTHPVPTIGGNNLELPCGPLDQRPVEEGNRTDVLTFTTAPLADDVWLTGPLLASLFVSSSAVDTDFTVKLTDVYADGTSRLIQDGIARARWICISSGCTRPQLLTPGKVYQVSVSLINTSYVFNKGHSIRVSVSSSNFPRFDINPNNGLPLTTQGPNVTASNVLYMSSQYPSAMVLPIVQPAQVPAVGILQPLVAAARKEGKGHVVDHILKKYSKM